MRHSSPWDLDFASSRKEAQKHIGRKLEILSPLVRTGHALLYDCRKVCSDDTDAVVAVSFRQCLEFVDSVDLLLRHLIIAPAIGQARSALESAACTCYLAKKRDPVLSAAFLLSSMRHLKHELERKMESPHLDEEDRRAIRAEIEYVENHCATLATDHASRTALAALRNLGRSRAWYSILNGPQNIHRLMEDIGIGDLSQIYSDLNSAVHEGMPPLGFVGADGRPVDPSSAEWLRPLRAPSPWSFRPVMVGGLALKISLVTTAGYFLPRLPGWLSRLEEFRVEHNRRCEAGEMTMLSL
ncbi:MAG TPA: DUF5677 domain-containing protein [Longimicrobiaceae bacterium]